MNFDVRSRLMKLGIGQVGATMAIPYAFMLPRSTDTGMTPVRVLTSGIQNGLRALGCDVEVDGVLGPKTGACLRKLAGDRWYDMTWLQLVDEVNEALRIRRSLGDEEDIESQLTKKTSPSPVLIGALVLGGGVLVHHIIKKA